MNEHLIQTVAKLEERLESFDRRITKNEDMTLQIHELASSVKSLSNEVRGSNERMEKILTSLDDRLKTQGERIGELEKRGSKKLESIVATVVTVLVTAVVMYFVGNIGIG